MICSQGLSRVTSLFARPPPKGSFDLETIEAFEAELEEKERIGDNTQLEDDTAKENIISSEMNLIIHAISSEIAGKRVDAAISVLEPAFSRSFCGSLVTGQRVTMVDKHGTRSLVERKSLKVEEGQTIEISIPPVEKTPDTLAQDLHLDIIFEDEHIIVINKAAGMVVHPAVGNLDGTVVNALAYYLAKKSPYGSGDFIDSEGMAKIPSDASLSEAASDTVIVRPGIVHRLDKGTTGVLVVAKTSQALTALSESFAAREVKKTYLAITVGNPGKRVVIDKPIGRHPRDRQRMRVVPDPHKRDSSGMAPKDRLLDERSPVQAGRRAISLLDTVSFDGKLSLVQVRIETGRTHQIRVHLQDRHTPIYGDSVYGLADWNRKLSKTHQIARPLLHAFMLELKHPVSGEILVFKAGLADDMLRIVKAIYPQAELEMPDLFRDNEMKREKTE